MNHEIWQPVVGFESRYEVSDYGKVRSLVFKNRVTSYRYDEPLMLKLTVMKNGYLRVNLHENGKNLNAFVHRIVLGAFVGPCPNGYQACHYNGIKDDNRLENLELTTKNQHMRDHNNGYRDGYEKGLLDGRNTRIKELTRLLEEANNE